MPEPPAVVEARCRGEEGPLDRLQRERIGVTGDPTPDYAYRDEPPVEDLPNPPCPACDQHGDELSRVGEAWRCVNPQCRVITYQEGYPDA
jgi:hypothetical protein